MDRTEFHGWRKSNLPSSPGRPFGIHRAFAVLLHFIFAADAIPCTEYRIMRRAPVGGRSAAIGSADDVGMRLPAK